MWMPSAWESKVIPVSVMPHGEYGINDLYVGIPAVLTGDGVKELVEYHLTPEEDTRFQKSVRVLQEAKDRLKEKMQIYR